MTEYRIATSVLEDIVRGSLAGDERIRVHSSLALTRTRPVEINVQSDTCTVALHLDARLGEHLPALASEARSRVAGALVRITGLAVTSVDIVFASVFPTGA